VNVRRRGQQTVDRIPEEPVIHFSYMEAPMIRLLSLAFAVLLAAAAPALAQGCDEAPPASGRHPVDLSSPVLS
jgi:hypothetical protein